MTEDTFADRLRLRRAAAGLTQRELASSSGLKQPLIAALESGTRQPTATAREALENVLQPRPSRLLEVAKQRVLESVRAMGGEDVRVFGSVANGTDQADSDIDLLITFPSGADIVSLLTLEEDLANLLTVRVDVVSSAGSGPVLRRALADAVPL